LSGILEVVRLLAEAGCQFPGEILVTAYGLHEAPQGDSKALFNLIKRGVVGDAAIVFEGFEGMAVVCGKGQSIWNLHLSQREESCHELRRKPEADLLLTTAMDLVAALRKKNDELAQVEHGYPLLGPETVFVGQLHYGDFYNRVPKSCSLQGTWRWHPNFSFEQAQESLHRVVEGVAIPSNVTVREDWIFVGESFEVDPAEPIVQALKSAFQMLYGREMEEDGTSGVADTSRLVPVGKVPTVLIDCDGATAHADFEFVRLDLVEENCRLAVATVLEFFAGQVG
jgi:acetylornithine deacetylase/succinyl-diaminopimelate desuccinylase-like protein